MENVGVNLKLVSFAIIYFMTLLQFGTDLYLPSFPDISSALDTSDAYVQISLSLFLFGFAISQLIYGPLSDRFGRKLFIVGGMLLFLLSSLMCAFSQNILWLLIGRLLQGLGAGSASVISRAMMKDCFSGKDLEKLAAMQAVIWSFVPMIAPVLGSYVQAYLGWRSNFYLLSVFASLAVMVAVSLPETNQNKQLSISFVKVFNNYKKIITNLKFVAYALCPMCIVAMNMSFNTVAPFLFQQGYGLTVVSYGWIILIIAVSFLIGTVINRSLLSRISSTQLIKIGVCIVISTSALLFVITILDSRPNLILVIVMLIFTWIGTSLVYSNCAAQIMHIFPELAGSSAALFGCMVFIGGMTGSAVIAHLPNTDLWGFSSLVLLYAVIMLIFGRVAQK